MHHALGLTALVAPRELIAAAATFVARLAQCRAIFDDMRVRATRTGVGFQA